MTNRRGFIAGLLATAAALPIPAQPVAIFGPWVDVPIPPWFYADRGARLVYWSDATDFESWCT